MQNFLIKFLIFITISLSFANISFSFGTCTIENPECHTTQFVKEYKKELEKEIQIMKNDSSVDKYELYEKQKLLRKYQEVYKNRMIEFWLIVAIIIVIFFGVVYWIYRFVKDVFLE